MANEDPKVVAGNLKVPPLKIVLSAHQSSSNLVGSVSVDEDAHVIFKTSSDKTKEPTAEERPSFSSTSGRRTGAAGSEGHQEQREKHHKRTSKSTSESVDDSSSATRPTRFLSTSSSTSSSSDRSSSTTPSSESESLASNSTIISDHNQEKSKSDTTTTSKDDSDEITSISVQKPDRSSSSRHGTTSRTSSTHKSNSANSSSTPTKRTHDQEQSYEQHTPSCSAGTRELTSNSNQRITRSSQRAAQQTKAFEITADSNGDESLPIESHEKIPDCSRKVKRRKGEVQDNEHDTQSTAQAAPTMANICPADYLLPSQNSFELYRDIRKQPYKKLMKLSHIQPKIPLGFKDYLINGGPYLLEGNKLGTGIGGHRIENLNNGHSQKTARSNRVPLRTKLSNHKNGSNLMKTLLQRHSLYAIPKPLEAPNSLQVGTPLYDLFQEQEKARQQMRMQHLKERERAILASEQEILRAYNNAAIADVRQKRHLSACTFFYYQERYHYLDDNTRVNSSHQLDGDNSSLINDNQNEESKIELAKNKDSHNVGIDLVERQSDTHAKEKNGSFSGENTCESRGITSVKTQSDKNDAMDKQEEDSTGKKETSQDANGSRLNPSEDMSEEKSVQRRTCKDTERNSAKVDGVATESKNNNEQSESLETGLNDGSLRSPLDKDSSVNKNISDEELKLLNKEIFITQLHQIDDKWDYIKRDMMVRHKNEADSLNAVQSLDWEWKAKEIGACDVRVTLKVEPKFVPKVEVEAHNY